MEFDELVNQVLATWQRHNEILIYLLEQLPKEGLNAVPTGSRGRNVAAQFVHLHRNRLGWLYFHQTGKRPRLPRYDKENPPSKAQLKEQLTQSGKKVEEFIEKALNKDVQPKMFGKQVIRWMGYLIAHDSHHRGQILLALKQNGLHLPEKVAVQGLWGKWISGK
jgi:uncharacterized damage-inducible protein DinB